MAKVHADLNSIKEALAALTRENAEIRATLSASLTQEREVIDRNNASERINAALAMFDDSTAGDAEADYLNQAADLEIKSGVIATAAEAGLVSKDGVVRAAAARALAISSPRLATERLAAFIAGEKNSTVRQIAASALAAVPR